MARTFGVELEYLFSPRMASSRAGVIAAAGVTKHPIRDWSNGRDDDFYKSHEAWTLKWEDGAEITTPAFEDLKTLQKSVRTLFPYLREANREDNSCGRLIGSRSYDMNCGMHVHVDIKDFRKNLGKILTLVVLYANAEKYFQGLQPKGRQKTEWCGKVEDKVSWILSEVKSRYKLTNREWETKLTAAGRKGLGYMMTRLHSKSISLNIAPRNQYGTVEFRSAQTSMKTPDVVYWAQLCLAFVNKAAKFMETSGSIPKFKTFRSFLSFTGVKGKCRDWCLKKAEKRRLLAL